MVKLLLCLGCGMAIAVAMLELRQQELELKHRSARLQEQIEGQQAKLWNQQLQIAIYTAPSALAKTVGQHQLELVPEGKLGEAGVADANSGDDRDGGGGF